MRDLAEIERRAHTSQATAEEFDQLAEHYWDLAASEPDFRKESKLLKRSCFLAGKAFHAGISDAERLSKYIEILNRALQRHTFPGDHRSTLSKIIARRLDVLGVGNAVVLGSAKGRVNVEGGTLGIGDPTLSEPVSEEAGMIALAQAGKRFSVTTGYDGVFPVELRQVGADEPILTAKEYRRLTGSSSVVRLHVPSGRVGIGEALDPSPGRTPGCKHVFLDVEPSDYKVCLFGFSTSRSDKVIAVIAEAANSEENDVSRLEDLFD